MKQVSLANLRYISLNRIIYDPDYQLPPNEKQVNTMAENWDATLVPPVEVAERKRWFRRTRYYIIDGAYRVEAARKRGLKKLPAVVIYRGLTQVERAHIYMSRNTTTP